MEPSQHHAHPSTVNGTTIDLRDCDHTLSVMGRCLNDKGLGGSSPPVVLYRCNGGSNENWTRDASTGQYELKTNGLCLNVKGAHTDNGTPLVMYGCNGAANEKWSLPKAFL